ncbi:hypothetical protein HC028_11390 [Planosporangium flavigriseum]|uniref:Uncharacterized protein n=1 Tax=Planosporangium flavigriseum TaxID=373681 RepID=A0A8J3PKB4_9ACTN|nr:hypothetical protein [Planosporangium flavigriseum]NJC65102.1 hypothetical protein [Planosporangium flavigriseum]GIG71718.1 hypothetical protein Pfl04_01220 [Planosporangium flavigriseum]
MSTEERPDKVPSSAEGGMNVTPGDQTKRKVYKEEPGQATAGAGHPGTGTGGPVVSGISEASRGAATGIPEPPEDEQ